MYTQCPECLTIFEVDEDSLQASLGIVHCGHCTRRFDALRTLSDTLPAEPHATLFEQDPAELAPILTGSVPPSALEVAAMKQDSENDATPAAPVETFDPAEPHPEPAAGETLPPASGQTLSSDSSEDWFADLETELTFSLIADAAGAPRPQGLGNTWQVSVLPAQPRYIGLHRPVTFVESWSADTDSNALLEARAPLRDVPDAAADSEASGTGAPDATTTEAQADVGPPPIEQAWTAFEDADSVVLDEPGESPADATASWWQDTLDTDAPIPDNLALAGTDADSVFTESDVALEASMPLPLETTEPVVAEPPDAVSAEPDPVHVESESDPTSASAPVYVRPRRHRVAPASVAWALGCLVLALVLAAQLAWTKRVELFRNPATRPWVARVCQTVSCRLPPIKDIAKLELLSRDIRPDPHTVGTLTITTTVRNNATFRQPWPVVVVELTDLDNNPVAMRRFRPAEYMPDPARRTAGIAPGATAAIAFEVADPGKRAVAFQFSFQ